MKKLLDHLRTLAPGGIALAYSGGVDSSLLLAILQRLKQEHDFPLLALTMRSPFAPWGADAHGTEQLLFDFDPFAVPVLRDNPKDRCYHCKHALFSRLVEIIRERGIATLIDGTNADDLGVYRPGIRALEELGVRSPLAELGIGKKEIRAWSAELGLPTANLPSAPCLATRFPYGTHLTVEALHRVAEGERLLRAILPATVPLRLRCHEHTLARIEIPPEHFPTLLAARDTLLPQLRTLGFTQITLDLQGFRSGSMDT